MARRSSGRIGSQNRSISFWGKSLRPEDRIEFHFRNTSAPASPPPTQPVVLADLEGPRVKTWASQNDYATGVQMGCAVAIIALIGLFRADLRPAPTTEFILLAQELVDMEEIEQTQHLEEAPPPPRVPIPIEVPDDAILDDVVLDLDSALEINEALTPPPPPPVAAGRPREVEPEIFVVVEEMPEIIGGVRRLNELVVYPEMARRAGLEGRVVVQIIVDIDGVPRSPQIIRGAGPGLDQAAIDAVMQLRFIPGKQRGEAVRVRMNLPVNFRLSS
jgi:periplasmic protein TonB